MNKTEYLKIIEQGAADKVATLKEVQEAYQGGLSPEQRSWHRSVTVTDILYYLGGAIIFLGLAVLIQQHWVSFNTVTRLLVTLGAGIAAFIIGALLRSDKRFQVVAQAFFLIAALILPIGLGVAFHEAGYLVSTSEVQAVMSGILLLTFFVSLSLWRSTLFNLFTIIFGTWFFFALTNVLFSQGISGSRAHWYEYRVLLVGLSYVLLGNYYQSRPHRSLTTWLYSVGILGFLAAALALGGWFPDRNLFWELIFPVLVLGTIFLSVNLRSRTFLVFGSIFLMAYILKITGEYFTNSLGWPVALILAGFALMAVGYGTVYLNKKYLSQKKAQA